MCGGVRHAAADSLQHVPGEQLWFRGGRAQTPGPSLLQDPAGHNGALVGVSQSLQAHPAEW